MDEYRTKLMELYERARDQGDGRLEFRCLRELIAVKEKRLRIFERMGLFDYWDRELGNQKVVKWLTKVDRNDPFESVRRYLVTGGQKRTK